MRTCPRGHESLAEDFCDRCGDALGPQWRIPANRTCRVCDLPLGGRYCERCGEDAESETPRPVRPRQPTDGGPRTPIRRRWTATVTIDADYHSAVRAVIAPDATAISLPQYCPTRQFVLTTDRILIGRRSETRGVTPTIDLSGPGEDPGVSRIHALLVRVEPDKLAVIDLNSVNGTNLNAYSAPIAPTRPMPLADGDVLYLGLWTAIRVRSPDDALGSLGL